MSAPSTPSRRNPLNGWRIRLLIRIASLNLIWEKLWPRLLPPLAVAALFVAVALLDLLPMLPFWVHIVALALFVGGFGYAVRNLMGGTYRSNEHAARRRVETDSGVAHRPLAALADQPVPSARDEASENLWLAHRVRMAALLSSLRAGLPAPGMARRDPHGWRAAVLLVLVIAAAAGVGDARARLERALIPERAALSAAQLNINLWITPPAYTGRAPIFLERGKATQHANAATDAAPDAPPGAPPSLPAQPETIRVPVGSTFLAQMSQGDKIGALVIGTREQTFAALDAAVPEAGARVEGIFKPTDAGTESLVVRVDGREAVSWPVRIDADRAPEVEFTQPPKNQGQGVLRVDFEARDDFGLATLGLIIRHPEGWPVPGGSEAVNINLGTPGLGTPLVKGAATQDLTWHPWAGTTVALSLRATDAADQAGTSDSVTLILPKRTFNHPVARAIIKARQKLNRPGRTAALDAIKDIEDIAVRPAHFFEDTVVFLTMAVARARLLHDGSGTGVAVVQKLLWDAALRIEDGEFAIADRGLEDAQRRLMEALRGNDANRKDLNRLLDQLQKAMDDYMQALMEQMQRQGLDQMPQLPSNQMMESGDLQRMMDQIRKMMQTGSIEAAKQMLAQLNQMLEALRRGARTAQQPRGPSQERKMLQGLRDLTKRQQELLDKTFRQMQQRPNQQGQQGQQGQQNQQGQKSQQGDRQSDQMAGEQESLRKALGRLMLQMDQMLGAIPPTMGKADRSMKGARQSLGRGDRAGAVPQQTQALEQLRQATEGMAEQLARRMQGRQGMAIGRQGQQPPRNRDPFGRRPGEGANGEFGGGAVKIPTRRDLLRSKEILDELRNRFGDHTRPRIELDYLDRLLRRF